MKALLISAAFCGALLGVACKDDPTRPPASTEGSSSPPVGGGGSVASPSDAGGTNDGDGGDAGSCTTLSNTGTPVDQNAFVDDLPPGTGGTLADGTYDLVQAELYGTQGVPGLTNTTYQGSIRITGSTFERVLLVRSSNNAITELDATGTITPSGANNAVISLTCPVPSQEQVTYTVTDASLTLSNLTTKELFRFTKQP